MNVKIRFATEKYIPAIIKLYEQVDLYHVEILPEVFKKVDLLRTKDYILSWINNNDSDYIVAVQDNVVIGFLNIKKSNYPNYPIFRRVEFALIEDCVVDKNFRRKGIGKLLFEKAKKWMKKRNINKIQLNVWSANKSAISFYKNLGFKPISEKMELNLK